jgi:hypothetical protein
VSRVQRAPAAARVIDLDARRAALPPKTLTVTAGGRVISGDLKRLGLEVQVTFSDEPGRSKITSLTVSAADGVTVNALRKLPLRAIERTRDRDWKSVQRTARKMVGFDALTELKELLARLPAGEHRRVPGRFYELVASVYLAQINAGFRTPSVFMADATGTPLPTVQGWVRRARLRGLLPPARQGTAG